MVISIDKEFVGIETYPPFKIAYMVAMGIVETIEYKLLEMLLFFIIEVNMNNQECLLTIFLRLQSGTHLSKL